MREKALALLREQQCEYEWEKDVRLVLQKLLESELTIDLVGTIIDEAGHLIMYAINKQALLSEFCGGVLSYVAVHRIAGVDCALALYMAHQQERIGRFLQEELEFAYERIVNSLLAGKGERFGENAQD